ncbi:hypothetical protein EV421DRAFT_1788763 [Armillaria borealis]|uniref:Uncharacterized protein n=1 Tax=Armillaria borealis TaxID=47425 RepID=A0AA39JQV2_9AGAR|nr:hypothetical protein EV421DRAFT_1788763 [Armillaria borealis]
MCKVFFTLLSSTILPPVQDTWGNDSLAISSFVRASKLVPSLPHRTAAEKEILHSAGRSGCPVRLYINSSLFLCKISCVLAYRKFAAELCAWDNPNTYRSTRSLLPTHSLPFSTPLLC